MLKSAVNKIDIEIRSIKSPIIDVLKNLNYFNLSIHRLT